VDKEGHSEKRQSDVASAGHTAALLDASIKSDVNLLRALSLGRFAGALGLGHASLRAPLAHATPRPRCPNIPRDDGRGESFYDFLVWRRFAKVHEKIS